MFGFVVKGVDGAPTATLGGRVIVGAREQLEALMPGWEIRDVSDDDRPQLPVEEWVSGLGLRCFRPEGCDCCSPWSVIELATIVRDLRQIEALEETAAS